MYNVYAHVKHRLWMYITEHYVQCMLPSYIYSRFQNLCNKAATL